MKCPHCQTEMQDDAHRCENRGTEEVAKQRDASNGQAPASQTLVGPMALLAGLPDRELQKAYYGSFYLQLVGLLPYIVAFVPLAIRLFFEYVHISDGMVNDLSWHEQIRPWLICFLWLDIVFVIGYAIRNIRMNMIRIILQVLALIVIGTSCYFLLCLFKEFHERTWRHRAID